MVGFYNQELVVAALIQELWSVVFTIKQTDFFGCHGPYWANLLLLFGGYLGVTHFAETK